MALHTTYLQASFPKLFLIYNVILPSPSQMVNKAENGDKNINFLCVTSVCSWNEWYMRDGDQVWCDSTEMESTSYADVWCLLSL